MTKSEIDALIARAGLSDVISVFDSAIEVGWHSGHTGYTVLGALIRAERERIIGALLAEHSARGVWAAQVVRSLD